MLMRFAAIRRTLAHATINDLWTRMKAGSPKSTSMDFADPLVTVLPVVVCIMRSPSITRGFRMGEKWRSESDREGMTWAGA